MSTFLIRPENFDSLSEDWRKQLTEKINEALRQELLISPRAEQLDGFGCVMLSVATITPKEYQKYKLYGGKWEFVRAVSWICDRLLYEGDAAKTFSGNRGAA
jgi:hypothetical protein